MNREVRGNFSITGGNIGAKSFLDSRLRGNDGLSYFFVIPAQAGIQRFTTSY